MWEANVVQLALYFQSVEGIVADELFELGLAHVPETSQRSRTITPANPFLSAASATIDGLQFVVQVQAGRFDVIVSVPQSAEVDLDAGLPTFECLPILEQMVNFVAAIAPKALPTLRVALVANLCKPVASYRDAADIVGDLLDIDVARDDLSDLSFQVNRRKPLDSGQEINRLVRLGVITVQTLSVRMPHDGGAVSVSGNQLGVALMLDFNTVPSAVPFSPPVQAALVGQLKDEILVVANAEKPIRSVLDNV